MKSIFPWSLCRTSTSACGFSWRDKEEVSRIPRKMMTIQLEKQTWSATHPLPAYLAILFTKDLIVPFKMIMSAMATPSSPQAKIKGELFSDICCSQYHKRLSGSCYALPDSWPWSGMWRPFDRCRWSGEEQHPDNAPKAAECGGHWDYSSAYNHFDDGGRGEEGICVNQHLLAFLYNFHPISSALPHFHPA